MSSFAATAVFHPPSIRTFAGNVQRWAVLFWQTLIFCALFSVIFLPEFAGDADRITASSLYGKAFSGFRFVDLGILALVMVHVAALACSRRTVVRLPRSLAAPGTAFLACIAIGVCYGHSRGGSNFFFDWRAGALGIGLYCVWACWMQDERAIAYATHLFASYMAARIALLYGFYLAGHGAELLGVAIPTFDGPTLSGIVFMALLSLRCLSAAETRLARVLWLCLAAASYLMVVLCFRRTYWAELAMGTVILLLLQPRHRLRNAAVAGSAICVAAIMVGQPFSGRLQSLDFTQTDGEFSVDNSDHLHDLQDAWDQVRQSPVMGIGVGTAYPTWRIQSWKNESVMVHNAPLHVWLKYGIAGLICYWWFHIALLRALYQKSHSGDSRTVVFQQAAAAYITAQFITTLSFAPWPYSELQMTTLLSFILAVVFMSQSGRESACLPQM